jgi:hypothetical protein
VGCLAWQPPPSPYTHTFQDKLNSQLHVDTIDVLTDAISGLKDDTKLISHNLRLIHQFAQEM